MASILFLLEVVAFVVVVWWAFLHTGRRGQGEDTGLLAMRSGDRPPSATRTPVWKASALQRRPPPGLVKEARANRAEPHWKTSRPRPRPPG